MTRARTLLKFHGAWQEVGYLAVRSEVVEDFKKKAKNEMSSVLLIPSFDYNTRLNTSQGHRCLNLLFFTFPVFNTVFGT